MRSETSEIDPEFSFPTTNPSRDYVSPSLSSRGSSAFTVGSAPPTSSGFAGFVASTGNSASTNVMNSPSAKNRPKRHQHRRSAAMSEDLSAVELATLLTPQVPSTSTFVASSPKAKNMTTASSVPAVGFNTMLNTPMTPTMRSSAFHSGPPDPFAISFEDSPRPESLSRVSFVSSPSPRRPLGEPGQLVSQPASSGSLRSSLAQSNSNQPTGNLLSYGQSSLLQRRPSNSSPRLKNSYSSLLASPAHSTHSGDSVPESDKRKKRRFFAKFFRKSMDFGVKSKQSPPESPHTEDTDVDIDADATLIPSTSSEAMLRSDSPQVGDQMGPFLGLNPLLTSALDDQALSTPRNSGELVRETLPTKPTIDLEEALNCSFEHRGIPEGTLESPFSKSSKKMGAVLEEEDEDDQASESVSLSSLTLRQPASILCNSHSGSSSSSITRQASPSPRIVRDCSPQPSIRSTTSSSSHSILSLTRDQYRGYLNTVSLPPPASAHNNSQNYHPRGVNRPSTSPPRSPRLTFEQVSNLAIGEPHSDSYGASSTISLSKESATLSVPGMSSPPPMGSRKTHSRRKSFIDRLIRRT